MVRGQTTTTTSFAMLGMLAVQPWSSYELTTQIRRSLARFWPRAASKLYEEPRKLVALGLATAQPRLHGRRRRTVYTITPAGRQVLARWLAEPAAPPVLESEQLLKVFLADHGTRADLLATLAAARSWAREMAALDGQIAAGYLSGEAPFPHRAALNTIVGRYLSDLSEVTERWADWATSVMQSWPQDMALAEPDRDTLRLVAGRAGPTDRADLPGPADPVGSAGLAGPIGSAGPAGPIGSAGPAGPIDSAGPADLSDPAGRADR
ncbi:helix-turn-helix transcriptional regulator [Pseudonocardia sp. NPDC049635]|uniref:PadR family transcriptional regulator n=1 Tax=Pseudonocardia sp. NPDC049635 TaxID=3155506 RepID=UPI0033D8BAD4